MPRPACKLIDQGSEGHASYYGNLLSNDAFVHLSKSRLHTAFVV